MSERLNLVLFSGTDDKLESAAILAAGAAAIGTPVTILLQFWALDAFRIGSVDADHGLSGEAGARGASAVREHAAGGRLPWAETLRQAKELGEVEITACTNSLQLLGLEITDLDPLVDGASGIATFFLKAGDGPITFI